MWLVWALQPRKTSTSRQCGIARTAGNERGRLTYRSGSNTSWEFDKGGGRRGAVEVVGAPQTSTSPPSRSLLELFIRPFPICPPPCHSPQPISPFTGSPHPHRHSFPIFLFTSHPFTFFLRLHLLLAPVLCQ